MTPFDTISVCFSRCISASPYLEFNPPSLDRSFKVNGIEKRIHGASTQRGNFLYILSEFSTATQLERSSIGMEREIFNPVFGGP